MVDSSREMKMTQTIADPRRRALPDPAEDQTKPYRSFLRGALLILAGAAALRIVIAMLMPCISRDGVVFCWFAEALGTQGSAYLRDAGARQHPLFPFLILQVHAVLRMFGAGESPLLWQAAGQIVTVSAGIVVVALTGALTLRWVRSVAPDFNAPRCALFAMVLAALLPLNVWHSADVMSDEVHLAFYLAAAVCIVQLHGWTAVVCCGIFAALAYLTRPEGAVPLIAALCVLGIRAWRERSGRAVGQALVLVVAFALTALPYWISAGTLSRKKSLFANVSTTIEPIHNPRSPMKIARASSSAPLLAKLELHDLRWFELLPQTLLSTFRAGRVVVPLLAIWSLLTLGSRLRTPGSIGIFLCILGHLALVIWLLERHKYQQPRHLLVVVALLTPLAGMTLAQLHARAILIRNIWPHILTAFLVYLPLALYAIRLPNFADRFWVRAATELRKEDGAIASKHVLSGSAGRRLAFYADASWLYWPEDATRPDLLTKQLQREKPEYFAIVIGPGNETKGNDEIAAALERGDLIDTAIISTLRMLTGHGDELRIYRFDRTGVAQD
ncbi:MAG: hypothetical protein AB7N71_07985 [Phycisphaerae bacterium]